MNGDLDEFIEKARMVFSQTKYYQNDSTEDKELLQPEIDKLASNMLVVKNRHMDKLNKNLVESGRKVWDFIAEHNFAIELLNDNPDVHIEYEPDRLTKPVDFVINKDGFTFWLQMKRLSNLERENKQEKLFRIIKEKLKEIGIPKFISIQISDEFEEADIEPLIAIIRRKALRKNNKYYRFQKKQGKRKAQFSFSLPTRAKLSNLVLGSTGDIGMVHITGLDANQIKKSLCKAALAFEWDSDATNINLIVMEADNKKDIDIGEACFGTEFNIYQKGCIYWRRREDGLFYDICYSSKIAGIIAVRRKLHKPITSYTKTIFINDRFKNLLEILHGTVDIDNTFYFSDHIPV